MLRTVIVANNCHFPHRSVAFLPGETVKFFQLFCQPCLPNFVRRVYPKLDETLKSLRQMRDVIRISVSFILRENEFAEANNASLPFQLLSNIFIFLFFVVSFSEIGISPGRLSLIGETSSGYTSTQIDS